MKRRSGSGGEPIKGRRPKTPKPTSRNAPKTMRGRTSLSATNEDVSVARQLEQSLRASEERYSLVVQAVAEGIYDWNIKTNALYVSPRLMEIFSFEGTRLTSQAWYSRVHADDRESYRTALRDCFRRGSPKLECQYRIKAADGTYRWVEDHGLPIRDKAGWAIRLVGAVSDITLRHQTEQALRESLQQQTATADVLKVISRSTFDLKKVLSTLVESAARLCAADKGALFQRDGEVYRMATTYGFEGDVERLADRPLRPDRTSVTGRVALEGKAVHVHDVLADPEYHAPDYQQAFGYRTNLGVPLLRDGTTIGVFALVRNEVNPFTEKQIELVTTFADQAVIAIENARLFEAEQQRTRELSESLEQQTATSEVLRVIGGSPGDLTPVFDAILANAVRICGAKLGNLFVREADVFRIAATHGAPQAYLDYLHRERVFRADPRVGIGVLMRTKQLYHIADLSLVPTYDEKLRVATIELAAAKSLIAVPMLKEGEVYGCIAIYRQEVRPFTDKQIELVENFAKQAVIAIENVRLLTELRQRTIDLTESLEQQTATANVLGVISRSAFDLQAVFETVAASSVRLCGADCGFIFRLDGNLLRMVVAINASDEIKEFVAQNPLRPGRQSASARAALERRTIHIPDVSADTEYTYGAPNIDAIRTLLAVPILKGDDLLGVMLIYHRKGVRPFTDKQIALVETFADQAAIAIENVRLLDALRQRTDDLGRSVGELRALGEVSQAVNSTLDLETVLTTIVANAARLSGTEAGAIYVYDDRQREFHLRATHGMDQELIDALTRQHIDLEQPNVAVVFAQREAVQAADLKEEAVSDLNEIALRAGFRARLVAPLLSGADVVGMLVVRRRTPGAFPQNTVDLIKTFAVQSALAIQNARLFHEIEDKGRQLEVASRHKSQFLANMSHELRTPLNAILGYTELILDSIYGEAPERMRAVLERVQSNGKHLLGLINDVLDLSKIEAGQLTLSLSDYSLADLVQGVYVAVEPLASQKGLTLKTNVAKGLPVGHGDERRLAQVLLNLVGNAIKFTDAGEVSIEAACLDGRFSVAVRDSGPGIAAADQAKIFEEFQQVDNTPTRQKGGTGLGLAISKRIVEMHDGCIVVDSELGKGSTFTVRLPVHARGEVRAE